MLIIDAEIIDIKDKRIYLKWYGKSCNQIIYGSDIWPQGDWRQQIKEIILDQWDEGVYKLTMYPHCHYADSQGQMRAIDWYGCVPIDKPYIEEKYMQGIIHDTAQFRLEETGKAVDMYLDVSDGLRGYGGMCLPKDTKALQYFLRDKLAIPMLDATLKTNSDMS